MFLNKHTQPWLWLSLSSSWLPRAVTDGAKVQRTASEVLTEEADCRPSHSSSSQKPTSSSTPLYSQGSLSLSGAEGGKKKERDPGEREGRKGRKDET